MRPEASRKVYRLTAWIACTGLVFCLFFQIDKSGPFRDINPFGNDPYDAVGSFAVQGVFLLATLTYARAVRLGDDPSQVAKTVLIYRGNFLVLGTMLVALISDGVAVLLQPQPQSVWGRVIQAELACMCVMVLAGIIAVWVSYQRIKPGPPPRDLTPADGIDDLWVLVRIPVTKAGGFLPVVVVNWVTAFSSDRLFKRTAWINPHLHAWRFACFLGLLVGLGLFLVQFQEGLPPSFEIALLLIGIFIPAELCATLLGFALLGGFLGLRQPILKHIL
jgi:hypothetical protein